MIENKLTDNIESAEYKLLFLTSVKDLSADQSLQVEKLLAGPIDWQQFLAIVEQHRIYPPVCRNLKKMAAASVKIPIMDKLEQLSRNYAMQALKLTGNLISITNLLESNQIKVISLKGPLLSQSIYGNVALRTSRDLDFLIDIQDLDHTIDLFVAEGYQIEHFGGELTAKKKHYIIKTNHHFAFIKNGLTVEIHWNFHFLGYQCFFSDQFSRSRTATISGREIHILAAEDEFLYLVFHGAKHGWHRLKWLADIAEIVRINQLDWTLVLTKSREYDILHILGQTLILLQRYYGIIAPAAIRELPSHKLAAKLSVVTVPIILGAEEQSFYFKKYSLVLFKNWRQKADYIISHFLPNHIDYEEIEFSDNWFFCYFLRRPFGKLRRLFQRKK